MFKVEVFSMDLDELEQTVSSRRRKKQAKKLIDLIKYKDEEVYRKNIVNICRQKGIKISSFDELDPNNSVHREIVEEYLTDKTKKFKVRLKERIDALEDGSGKSKEDAQSIALKEVLPDAYALVRLGAKFLWNQPHRDVQIQGGILMNDGCVTEMATGEGKTQTAAFPVYLNALLGNGVHVVTPNDYLAVRDGERMGELYGLLGLSCGVVKERKPVKLNDIDDIIEKRYIKKIESLIGPELAKAKTVKERENICHLFVLNNSALAHRLKEETRIEVTKEAKKDAFQERKKAYQCDITYGSTQGFAFDYLYDDLATSSSDMVHRSNLADFVLVDEMDDVLFDSAITPFNISGTQEDELVAITPSEIEDLKARMYTINLAVKSIYDDSYKGHELVMKINDLGSYKNIVNGDSKQSKDFDSEYAVIIDMTTREHTLTTLGEMYIFKYVYSNEIAEMARKNGWKNTDPKYLVEVLKSGNAPELEEMFNGFMVGFDDKKNGAFVSNLTLIDNAVEAWFVLEKGKDYTLLPDKKHPGKQIVSLIDTGGRTSAGRVYSNGLQQAVEERARYLQGENGKNIDIFPTKINDTLRSLPTVSYYIQYPKLSGMTGTSPGLHLKDIYGLSTYEVDRNKPSKAIDCGERFYPKREQKNEAIFREVVNSWINLQPILITTTSVEESDNLKKYIMQRFKEERPRLEREIARRYPGKKPSSLPQIPGVGSIDIPVLNANVNKLEAEARIISEAGLPGRIMISTQMAGRGTDIKLGGEADYWLEKVAEEKIVDILRRMIAKGQIQARDMDKVRPMISEEVHSDKYRKMIKTEADRRRQKAFEQAKNSGGLNVIIDGHFPLERIDRQVAGRCGRQSEPGKYTYFSDSRDLLAIGVPREEVIELEEHLCSSKDPSEESTIITTAIRDVVLDAQNRREWSISGGINYQREVDKHVDKWRRSLRKAKESLNKDGNYVDAFEYMIEETAKSIVVASVPQRRLPIRKNKRIRTSHLDMEKMYSLIEEFMGIEVVSDNAVVLDENGKRAVTITKSEISEVRTLGELYTLIADKGIEKYERLMQQEPTLKESTTTTVVRAMERTWRRFEETVDDITEQRKNNMFMQYQTSFDILEGSIPLAYENSMESERAIAVRSVLHPSYLQKYGPKARNSIREAVVTPRGLMLEGNPYADKIIEEQKGLREMSSIGTSHPVKMTSVHQENVSPQAKYVIAKTPFMQFLEQLESKETSKKM